MFTVWAWRVSVKASSSGFKNLMCRDSHRESQDNEHNWKAENKWSCVFPSDFPLVPVFLVTNWMILSRFLFYWLKLLEFQHRNSAQEWLVDISLFWRVKPPKGWETLSHVRSVYQFSAQCVITCTTWIECVCMSSGLQTYSHISQSHLCPEDRGHLPDEHDRSDPGHACAGTWPPPLSRRWRIRPCRSLPSPERPCLDQTRADRTADPGRAHQWGAWCVWSAPWTEGQVTVLSRRAVKVQINTVTSRSIYITRVWGLRQLIDWKNNITQGQMTVDDVKGRLLWTFWLKLHSQTWRVELTNTNHQFLDIWWVYFKFKNKNSPPWQQKIFSSTMAAIGRQLKQSVKVFQSLMLYLLLPKK